MKRAIHFILIGFLLALFTTTGQSQILRRVANDIGRKVAEKKIDKEIDRRTDEIADSIVQALDKEDPMSDEERAEAAKNRKKAGQLLGRMMGGMNQADLQDNYSFSQKLVIIMEDEKGKTNDMTMFYNNDSPVIGYQMDDNKDQAFIIMDFDNEYLATFTESNGDKNVISMPIPIDMLAAFAEEAQEEEDNETASIEKTGRTKTIRGYHCEEYVMKDKDTKQTMWITSDVKSIKGFEALTKQFSNQNKRMKKMKGDWPAGFPVEVEIEDMKSGKKSYMHTQEIETVNFSFPASEYEYMSLGGR